jgi:hypothetical protein
MSPPRGTVFFLASRQSRHATDVILHPANRSRQCTLPGSPELCLRIGVDQPVKKPPYLATFGRRDHNDVILGYSFSRHDQCYFDFHQETGELLLHDTSSKSDTQLYHVERPTALSTAMTRHSAPHIWKSPRQCVVLLAPDPSYTMVLRLGKAEFRIVLPPPTDDGDGRLPAEDRLAFACQPDPERTALGTMERLAAWHLQSDMATTYKSASTVNCNPHNTRFQTALEPEANDVIRYTKLASLGSGGQGDVHKVVDRHDGRHLACKVLAVKSSVPELEIYTERSFKQNVALEVTLVKQFQHVSCRAAIPAPTQAAR